MPAANIQHGSIIGQQPETLQSGFLEQRTATVVIKKPAHAARRGQ
jgi:hypothetical protein